jgi:hypothetical protein
LVTSFPKEPFMKWELDFVGPTKLTRRYTWNKYILVAIYYVTKWMEIRTLKTINAIIIIFFMYEWILTKFGCPLIIITN